MRRLVDERCATRAGVLIGVLIGVLVEMLILRSNGLSSLRMTMESQIAQNGNVGEQRPYRACLICSVHININGVETWRVLNPDCSLDQHLTETLRHIVNLSTSFRRSPYLSQFVLVPSAADSKYNLTTVSNSQLQVRGQPVAYLLCKLTDCITDCKCRHSSQAPPISQACK